MFLLFAPQGSGEAESLTPLKWRTTSLSKLLFPRPAFGSRMGVFPSWTAVIDRCWRLHGLGASV